MLFLVDDLYTCLNPTISIMRLFCAINILSIKKKTQRNINTCPLTVFLFNRKMDGKMITFTQNVFSFINA